MIQSLEHQGGKEVEWITAHFDDDHVVSIPTTRSRFRLPEIE